MEYSNFIGYLLSVSFRLLKKRIDKVLAPYDLTAPQWGVLSRLYEEDKLTLVDISAKLQSDPSTIKLIIDKLEKKRLVKRKTNKKDKRVSNICLTEEGRLLEKPLKNLIIIEIEYALKNFSNDEIKILKKLLKKMIINLTKGESNMPLIKDYKLELFPPPCFPGAVHWSAKVDINGDLTDFLPYLNGYFEKNTYNPNAKTLVCSFDNHKVAIRPKEIKIGNLIDKNEGEKIAKQVIELINELWEKKDELTPNYEKKEPPKVIDIYKILPKTNCKKCNHPSCFVFATKLSQGDEDIESCPELNLREKELLKQLFFG